MKKIILPLLLMLCSSLLFSQNIGIGTNTPHASALLEIKSSAKGILMPRTSTTSRLAIVNAAKGLLLYDSTAGSFWYYNGNAWAALAAGNSTWNLSGNTGTNPSNQFIGTADEQPLRFRLNNTWAGELHPTSGNIYLGMNSGEATTLGGGNTAIGEHALRLNTEGSFNTATGYESLAFTVAGHSNTASGAYALFHNTAGIQNTAAGRNALFANTTGNQNTAVGANALLSNTIGIYNTAVGSLALQSNVSSYNTATGSSAMEVNYSGVGNTANGFQALNANYSGSFNTAAGFQALQFNSTAEYNTAVGASALYHNTTAQQNTAVGAGALGSQSFNNSNVNWVSANTAVGYQALQNNQPTSAINGIKNTAVGHNALSLNSSGAYNTAIGQAAMLLDINGNYNTAIGFEAMRAGNGAFGNTAAGYQALFANSNGYYNAALGGFALHANSTGNSNTAVGDAALSNNISGHHNISIGASSGTHPNTTNLFNTISIGNDDILNAFQNQVFLGNTSTGWIGGKVTWSTFSDERIKRNIQEDVKGLEFIKRLRAVTYYMSNRAIVSITGNKETADYPGKNDNEKVKYSGFIAQEVEKAAKETGYDFSGVTIPRNEHELYTMSYEQFVVPLVKAVQEQQVIIEQQQNKITLQQVQYEILLKRIEALEKKN